jgi:hypothetical protein
VRLLPVPNGAGEQVAASAVDPTGRLVGGNGSSGQNFIPILWTDGQPTVLPVQAESGEVTAVNRNGVVVGLAASGTDQWVFRYDKGKVTRLRSLPGYTNPFPEPAVNAAGDVVINDEPVPPDDNSVPLIWRAGSTTAQKLPLPHGANIFGITDDGRLVGGVYVQGYADAAYVWDLHGAGQRLATPSGWHSIAYAIHGDWAIGYVFHPGDHGNSNRVVRWNLRTGAMTDLPAGGLPKAVNAAGWTVTTDTVTRGTDQVALAVPGSGTRALPQAISDTNLVVGAIGEARDTTRPAVWQCGS